MNQQQRPHLEIVYRRVAELIPNGKNARTHSPYQIRLLEASIKEFGFVNPVIVDRTGKIMVGHARVLGAKKAGLEHVPTIVLEDLTEDQLRAYVVADNRLAEKAGWDQSILAIELQHLISIEEFDVTLTGFEIPEIDLILEEVRVEQDKEDAVDFGETAPAVSRSGDLWFLEKHRVLCGSALDQTSFDSLMGKHKADLVFADAPYNLVIDGNVSGKGLVRHGDFAMASEEMSDAEFVSFLTTSLQFLVRYSSSGSVHFLCIDWRHVKDLLTVGEQIYDALLNVCVWAKDTGGQGSFYRSQHELVCVFRNGKGKNRNNILLGKFGRYRTNVWTYPSANTLSREGEEGNLLALHPTVKPVGLVADAILDCSARGDLVLDSFLGSGTTLIAAERVGRICYGIELDPRYVDVAIRRWQRHTGNHAVHSVTRQSFDELAGAVEVCDGR